MAKRSSSKFWPRLVLATCLAAMIAPDFVTQALAQDAPAKQAFGSKQLPVLAQSPQSIGFYAKGCLSGGVALPIDGPNWQVMRLSRNRNWGHPRTIGLLEKLARDAAKDGWPGLLGAAAADR